MGVGAPSSVDLLEVLTEWAENGKAPDVLVQVSQETKPPFAPLAARPMCRYPAYPHYQGGDVTKAESFICRGI
jgi:tannase/feruloyl esterase